LLRVGNLNYIKMSVAELKNDLHKMVVETDDLFALQQIKQYFQSLIDDKYDWWNDLTVTQQKLVQQGNEDLEKGKIISNQAMRNKIDRFFEDKRK
jgi:hypothetical protein